MHILIFILDLNEYLSKIIKNWCDSELKKLDYRYTTINASEYFSNDTRTHCSVYLQFQAILQTHIIFKRESHLSLCKKSKKAWKWNFESIIIEMNDVTNADISEERENSETTSEDFVENLKIESIKDELENEC